MKVLLSPSHRRAERFATLLDDGSTAPEFADALATVASIRQAADAVPAPRADFVSDLRSRLMAEADTALVATDQRLFLPDRSTTGRRQGRAAAVAAALVIVGGSAGISMAAQSSLPGESLYSIKRGIENTHEALSFSNAAQGRALLDQASARLGEAQRLEALGESEQASATLDSFTSSAGAGADLLFHQYQSHPDVDAVSAVRDFAGSSMGDVDALAAKAPASMRPSLVAAAQLLADLDQQARVLCAECGARSPLIAPSDLELAAAPTLQQLLVDPSAAVPAATVAQPAAAKAPAGVPIAVPDVAGTLTGTTGSPTTPAAPAAPKPATVDVPAKVKKPTSALPPTSLPPTSLPSTVTTVTNGVGQILTGTVDGLTSTVNGLINLTGLTPKP